MLNKNIDDGTGVNVMDFNAFVAMIDGNKSAKFVSLLYRAKGTGELARHCIMLNTNRNTMLKHDLAKLQNMRPNLSGWDAIACDELIASILKSLAGVQDQYTKKDYYQSQGNGNVQVSVKAECYIRGYTIGKEVIEKGEYKNVKSSVKTLAKDALRKDLKNTRCREFIINPENFKVARHAGKAIIIDATGSNLNKLASLPPVTLAVPVTA
jgi:hypothetical protein